ncbi:D-alanyl-d-alanine carboxypeptidase [Mycena sanguinolenta]|uniref:D-alanyl-d-alanine carboxypeptidase n=1 Tax=Mycena sanguinolenta TaxID=230812 RepID=A0A8H6X6E0_9AGAR|nr:D-alanyl-d-alanine carboxypeptidase [Mycena sanguinolenta]
MKFLCAFVLLASVASTTWAAVNGPCSSGPGVCISTTSCNAGGGSYTSGLCPKDPEEIKCCTKAPCTTSHLGGGQCEFTSKCTGSQYTISALDPACAFPPAAAKAGGGSYTSGLCPWDPEDIKCCTKAPCSPSPFLGGGQCEFTSKCTGNHYYISDLCPVSSARNSHLSLACHEILVCPRSLRIGLNHPCCNQRSLHLWARCASQPAAARAAAASAPLASAHTTPMTSSAAQSRRVGPPLVGTDSVSLPTPAPDTITIPRMSRKTRIGVCNSGLCPGPSNFKCCVACAGDDEED